MFIFLKIYDFASVMISFLKPHILCKNTFFKFSSLFQNNKKKSQKVNIRNGRVFFPFLWCSHIGNHPHKDLTKFGYPTSRTIKCFCNHVIVSWLARRGLLNLVNLVQKPCNFGNFFQKNWKQTFVGVATPNFLSHFGIISHKRKLW
jgi:hypothetical protein